MFPIQNLPYGIFSTAVSAPRVGVAYEDNVLDLALLEIEGLLETHNLFNQPALNPFMAAGRDVWTAVRRRLQTLLSEDLPRLQRLNALVPQASVTMHLPAHIGDYTDFYASREHATNVGTLFRGGENALPPNWLHLPIGYHGRASSIVVSGTPIQRPHGQLKPSPDAPPVFAPSQQFDYELEIGAFIGRGNALGQPIPIDEAEEHIFGLVLLNDWSARDIQRWEYVPLGPFLGKSVATTISPWVVTLDALEPFRTAGPVQEPAPLPYLQTTRPWAFDIQLQAQLNGHPITHTNFKYLYWNLAQQVAHHTSNGCNLRPGDLLGSGTISGPTAESVGSLLEQTHGGQHPLTLPDGSQRTFLQDGDMLTLTGYAQGDGFEVGFGRATGTITNDE